MVLNFTNYLQLEPVVGTLSMLNEGYQFVLFLAQAVLLRVERKNKFYT